MGAFKLTSEIINLSVSKDWETAKKEWLLSNIYFSDDTETCLCGHNPIKELCELSNSQNSNVAIVGNCCVKKFIGLPSNKIFQAIKRVRKKNYSSLNIETIEYAFEKSWINDWEKSFYLDTFKKRILSAKQANKRVQINLKIIEMFYKSS